MYHLQRRDVLRSPARIARPLLLLALLLAAACRSAETGSAPAGAGGLAPLSLPELSPAALAEGERLEVLATTNVIGDVVSQVGGEAIDLTTLIGAGQDPHGYQPAPSDLISASQAHVIFANGWGLEEGLVRNLENAAAGVPLVPISAGITPLPFGGEQGAPDPHVWLDPHLVRQWVENVQEVLSALDPARAAQYEANAAAYLEELEALITYAEERLATVPAGRRQLVTNHEALAYFARAFDFEVIGTVIPSASTVSEPSARALASLVDRMEDAGVCTIFADHAANQSLAAAAAAELQSCPEVAVLPLYTGSLGPPGSGAESYVEMMRVNVDTIVSGLAP
jgi:ABC-type Zn uptake system ZnuABC Zn-binding protein ZnuA